MSVFDAKIVDTEYFLFCSPPFFCVVPNCILHGVKSTKIDKHQRPTTTAKNTDRECKSRRCEITHTHSKTQTQIRTHTRTHKETVTWIEQIDCNIHHQPKNIYEKKKQQIELNVSHGIPLLPLYEKNAANEN